MEPNRFGRTIGIGVRVASRMWKERAQASGEHTASTRRTVSAASGGTAQAPRAAASRPTRKYAEPVRRVGQGTRRFGQAFFGPLAHTGATLWLEITGLFFALFALFFAQNLWKLRAAYRGGPEHAHFLLYVILTLAFCYFCASSFMRARRLGKKRARR